LEPLFQMMGVMPGNKLLSGIIFFSYAVESKVSLYYYSIKLLAMGII